MMYVCSTSNTVSPLFTHPLHNTDIIHCLFSSNDKYVFTADEGGIVRMTNTLTKQCERLFIAKTEITCLTLCNKDYCVVVGGEDGWIYLFSVISSNLLVSLKCFDVVRIERGLYCRLFREFV